MVKIITLLATFPTQTSNYVFENFQNNFKNFYKKVLIKIDILGISSVVKVGILIQGEYYEPIPIKRNFWF